MIEEGQSQGTRAPLETQKGDKIDSPLELPGGNVTLLIS